MKYLFKPIGLLVLWITILIPYLLIERVSKVIFIACQILWHFKVKEKWLYMFNDIEIALCIFYGWTATSYKNYFLLKWKKWYDIIPDQVPGAGVY